MDEFGKAYNDSLRFLSYRPRSEKEVRDHFKIKDQSASWRTKIKNRTETDNPDTQEIIDKVIQKLKDQNFINDEEFVKWWVDSRERFKPRSEKLIKMELRKKGISKEIIERIISNDKFLISSDLEMAKKIIGKKMPQLARFSKEKQYQKLQSLLLRRGFTYDIIKEAIDLDLSGVFSNG